MECNVNPSESKEDKKAKDSSALVVLVPNANETPLVESNNLCAELELLSLIHTQSGCKSELPVLVNALLPVALPV